MQKPRYITKLDNLAELSNKEKYELFDVSEKFPFRANDYYLSLINWDDPDDPIRRIIIPHTEELENNGKLDPSNEKLYTRVFGLEHKYEHIALLLVNDVCGGFCRFCFRKRLFMKEINEVERDLTQAYQYIREHKELNNVLITGGDPLLLSTRKIDSILRELRSIDHISIIRIGSKIPAFNPFRILEDDRLLDVFDKYSTPSKCLYLMTHFNHPRELSGEAIEAMYRVRKAGVKILNQTPIIRGVNDSPEVLSELFNTLSFAGITPYYVFQCRPTIGNAHLAVPVERGFEIHEQAKMNVSGVAKTSKYVMSHTVGKIQVLGLTEKNIYLKFHRSANPLGKARIIVYRRNPDAYWYDDFTEIVKEYTHENPFLLLDDEDESSVVAL